MEQQPQQQQQQQQVQQYLSQMSPLEKQGYEIARSHLNTSFNIVRSNGFMEWLKKK